jgi:magnesium chelatase family protein
VLVKTFGSAVYGIEAITITIEVNISGGAKPFYLIVGLPDNAVRESMQRIEAALQTNNFRMSCHKFRLSDKFRILSHYNGQ